MNRRVVVSKIVGGFGNPLFCYATARCLGRKNNTVLCFRSSAATGLVPGRDRSIDPHVFEPR